MGNYIGGSKGLWQTDQDLESVSQECGDVSTFVLAILRRFAWIQHCTVWENKLVTLDTLWRSIDRHGIIHMHCLPTGRLHMLFILLGS